MMRNINSLKDKSKIFDKNLDDRLKKSFIS